MTFKSKIGFIISIIFILLTSVVMGINGNEKIIFVSYEPGNSEIFIMNPDGSGRINLTQNDHHDVLPHISPDGTKIAYYCLEEQGIKSMNLDGNDKTLVLKSNNLINCPRWSPDGEMIVYMGFNEDLSSSNIFILDLYTGGISQVTDSNYYCCLPEWSPDGQKVAFVANPKGQFELVILDLASGNQKSIVTLTEYINDIEPLSFSWSPDGEKIAFAKEFGGVFDVCVIDLNGENLINLTKSKEYHDYAPTWSSSGVEIAFVSIRDDKDDIYIINLDGSGIKKITNFEGDNRYPKWFSVK